MLGVIASGVDEGTMDAGQAGEYLKESHRWLIREQLTAALSMQERALLAKALTDWTERDALARAGGARRSACCSGAQRPRRDAALRRAFRAPPAFVPLLAQTADFRGTANLRSAEDIGRAREQAARWHGRARAPQIGERDDPQVERVALDADGRAAVVERHYALNWLCGYASDWDSVPTDT